MTQIGVDYVGRYYGLVGNVQQHFWDVARVDVTAVIAVRLAIDSEMTTLASEGIVTWKKPWLDYRVQTLPCKNQILKCVGAGVIQYHIEDVIIECEEVGFGFGNHAGHLLGIILSKEIRCFGRMVVECTGLESTIISGVVSKKKKSPTELQCQHVSIPTFLSCDGSPMRS